MTARTLPPATADQIAAIRARAVNAATRVLLDTGCTLTHEQADELGEEAMDWIHSRLALTVETTDSDVTCTPATDETMATIETISTAANYDETYHEAMLAVDTIVSNDGWPSQVERGKSLADALNNVWTDGLTVGEWTTAAAARLGYHGV